MPSDNEVVLTEDGDAIKITHEKLDSAYLISAVTLPHCGAVSVFIGIHHHTKLSWDHMSVNITFRVIYTKMI